MKTESVQLDKTNKAVTGIDRTEIQTIPLTSDKIYLRVDGDFRLRRDIASFYYSYDNKDWKRIGPDFKMILISVVSLWGLSLPCLIMRPRRWEVLWILISLNTSI